jgi:hypothetical protein
MIATLHAAYGAFEPESGVLRELALPAAVGFFRKRVETPGDIGRRRPGLLGVAEDAGIEHAENRRLLDNATIVAAMQPIEDVANDARILDQLAQVLAGTVLAGIEPQHLLDTGIDQEILQRARP